MTRTIASARELFRADRRAYAPESWFYERSLWAIAVYRFGSFLHARFGEWLDAQPKGIRYLVKAPLLIALRMTEIVTGIELPPQTQIGPGLRIWHGGNVVINPRVKMGADCLLRHGVTIGNITPQGPVPVIGDRVQLGAYAQVLGGVHVGDDARVGAMTVVLNDVPAGATAVGVPARIIPARTPEA